MKNRDIMLLALLLTVFNLSTAQQNTTNLGNRTGTLGNNNSFFGFRSGETTTVNGNSFFGSFSGALNIDGGNNSFFGFNAGRNNASGNNNIFIGTNAGMDNTIGNSNSFLGNSAGRNSVSGNNNVFLGPNAGFENIEGSRNVYVGTSAGRNNTGNGNVFIGYQTGLNEIGNNMLFVDNSDTDVPLIFGKFNTDQVGINTTTIPNGVTLSVGGSANFEDAIFANGRLAIGTTDDDPGFLLTVKGKVHVQEVKVDLLGAIAPDYVFYKDYPLQSLENVAAYIEENGHLPNIPSASEMQANGINLKEMNLKLLEKVEELTLYTLQQQETIAKQQKSNEDLEARIAALEAILLKQ